LIAIQKYLKQGPLELHLSKVSGRHWNIQQLKIPVVDEAKVVLDNSSDQWPVTWKMLKEFCKNSDRHRWTHRLFMHLDLEHNNWCCLMAQAVCIDLLCIRV